MNTLQKKKINLQKKKSICILTQIANEYKRNKTYVLRNLTEVNATDRTAYIK